MSRRKFPVSFVFVTKHESTLSETASSFGHGLDSGVRLGNFETAVGNLPQLPILLRIPKWRILRNKATGIEPAARRGISAVSCFRPRCAASRAGSGMGAKVR